MKLKLKTAVASAAALAIMGAGLVAGAGSAFAATDPAWEPDANSQGSLTFYNAAGQQIYGGTNFTHLADFIAASSAGRPAANKASLTFAAPDHTLADTLSWAGGSASTATIYPAASPPAPASIAAITNPVVSLGASDGNLNNFLASVGTSLDVTAGYANVIQLRVKDSGATAALLDTYWSADIAYNKTASPITVLGNTIAANSWQVIYPAPVLRTTTTTTPTATPASSQAGDSVSFSTTVTPSSGALTGGSVQFFDGASTLGAPVAFAGNPVTLAGVTSLTVGTHQITATYSPVPFTGVAGSTSTPALSFVVSAQPAHPTAVTLGTIASTDATDAAGFVTQNHAVTGSAIVTDASVGKPGSGTTLTAPGVGTVEFYDGSSATPFASDTSSPFTFNVSSSVFAAAAGPAGAPHVITAKFVPADTAVYTGNTSPGFTLTVIKPAFNTDVQYIVTEIQPGTITITTPYNTQAYTQGTDAATGKPTLTPVSNGRLVLPDMTLKDGGAATGYALLGYQTSATFGDIVVLDTRAGNLPYTVSATADNLDRVGGNPGYGSGSVFTIDSHNVGLDGFALEGSAGAINNTSGTPTFTSRPAFALGATGTPTGGIGGTGASILANAHGLGTTTFYGTLTINAPTNTVDGTYTGKVTLSVIGS